MRELLISNRKIFVLVVLALLLGGTMVFLCQEKSEVRTLQGDKELAEATGQQQHQSINNNKINANSSSYSEVESPPPTDSGKSSNNNNNNKALDSESARICHELLVNEDKGIMELSVLSSTIRDNFDWFELNCEELFCDFDPDDGSCHLSTFAVKTLAPPCQQLFLHEGVEPLLITSEEVQNNDNTSINWTKYHCDAIFCPTNYYSSNNLKKKKKETSPPCQWSKLAIDTLLDATKDQCDDNNATVNQFYPPPEWEDYQLSDYLDGHIDHGMEYYHLQYPNSLAADYRRIHLSSTSTTTNNNNNNRNKLMQLTLAVTNRTFYTQASDLPPNNNTLVIHLRLGDVIDSALDSVRDLLLEAKYYFRSCGRKASLDDCIKHHPNPWGMPNSNPMAHPWNKYVNPLSRFAEIPNLSSYSNIVLMGSAHIPKNIPPEFRYPIKSCQYTKAIEFYLQRRLPNANISLRVGHPPDDDFVFAANAAAFIQSGGGYSRHIAHVQAEIQKSKINAEQ